jgi:Putative Actinobacterial Holin-X, holin superfamily III
MPTTEAETVTPTSPPAPEDGSLGAAAKGIAEHASALARLELELARFEIKKSITALGLGAALAGAALLVALYALGFGFATIAAGLATFLDWWLALLIVTIFLVLVVAVLGLLANRSFKRGGAPVPTQAIAEAKQTAEVLKS